MNNKGFLFSVLTFLLFLSVLVLVVSVRTLDTRTGIGQEKTRGVYDDIAFDYRMLVGLAVDVNRSASNVAVSFNDTIPLENGSRLISDYETFIEGYYAAELNTNVSFDATDPDFLLTPYSLLYGYPGFDKQKIMVRNLTGDADYVREYEVTLISNEPLTGNNSSVSGGTLPFILNASFSNDSVYYVGGVERASQSNWTFNVSGRTLKVSAGLNNIDGAGKASTLVIEVDEGLNISVQINAVLDGVEEDVGLKSGVIVGVADDVSRSDVVWLTPPSRENAPEFSTTTTTSTTTSTTTTSTSTSTTTSTTTSSTSTVVSDCGGFCVALDGYGGGICRSNPTQCSDYGEVYESGGDVYCTTPEACCCTPTTISTSTTSTTSTIPPIITTTISTTTTTTSTTSTTTSTTSTSTSTSSTTSTTTTINSCNDYCTANGYSQGTCRQNPRQCANNGETHEPGGDSYCTGGSRADTCCCAP